jgi:hypothetical protein
MRFHIAIMRPDGPGRIYTQAFHEVAETLAYGLVHLGHQVSHRGNAFLSTAQNIVLGPQFVLADTPLPEGTILYNLEQIGGNPNMLLLPELSKRYIIWDYSPANIVYWREHGIEARYVPIGYVPELTRIPPVPHPDIDVLFYGSTNRRRKKILTELEESGVKVAFMQQFGELRDAAISRSKVVLNLHYFDSPRLFEWVRVSYLLANLKAVVCETSDDFPIALHTGVLEAPYDALVPACHQLLENVEQRFALQERGFHLFSRMPEAEILKTALCKTSVTAA